MKKEFPMPEEQIGDKKEEEQKKSAKAEISDSIEQLKSKENKKNWLKEKWDKWREND